MSKQVFTTGQVLTSVEMTQLQTNDYNQTVSAKVASYVLVAADAGTRITMSNASATTVTINTALFAAGDTLIITNIGVGVCTITAGTATVSTAGSLALNQYDSGTLYFTSTGVAIWNGANPGDITGVTAGTGISGGGTSGTVTVTNSMATAITTAGDLLYGTGSGTFSRLGIGSSAQVLSVSSGVPAWTTPAGGGGKVLQVVSMRTATTIATSSNSFAATNVTATITPTLNTSKVLIFVSCNGCGKTGAATMLNLSLYRATTSIHAFEGIAANNGISQANYIGSVSTSYLDSPATTSATTYTVYWRDGNGAATVTMCEQYGNDSNSTMTLMEIGA